MKGELQFEINPSDLKILEYVWDKHRQWKVVRVPGGWIYSQYKPYYSDRSAFTRVEVVCATFVPWKPTG